MTVPDLPAPIPPPPRRTRWPLPPYRYVPGRHPHPLRSGAVHVPLLPEGDVIDYGVDLLRHRYLWEAHELWEARWKALAPGPERDGLHALIQVAAVYLLRHLGRAQAAATQAARATARLQAASRAGVRVGGLDPDALARALAVQLRQGGWLDEEAVWP